MSLRNRGWRVRHGAIAFVLLYAVVLPASPLLWFVCVDRRCILEACPDCTSDRDIVQYRVFRATVLSRNVASHVSPESTVATALGRPCPHKGRKVVCTNTFRGLVCPAGPVTGITPGLAVGRWFDDAAARALKAWARTSPKLADEYYQKVIVEHDSEYIRWFFKELGARAARERAAEKEEKMREP